MRIKELIGIFIIILILGLGALSPISTAQGITPIVLSNVELVTVDEDFAAITWVTNIPSDTRVQWGTTQDLGEEDIVVESESYHMGKISGLAQGTSYYYRVGSGDRWSGISTFTTLTDPGGGLISTFAIVADTHYDLDGQASPNGAMYEDSVQLVGSMVEELKSDSSLDFVIANGDMTNKGTEDDFDGFASEMDTLNVPWYPVLGNHDKTFENWYDWYQEHMGRDETYYSIDLDSFYLIILDSAELNQVQGNLDDEQLEWLDAELDAHADKPVLIFMHHMADKIDIWGITEDSKIKLDVVLADRFNVLSITSGHVHENIVSSGEQNHIYVTTAGVVSYPIGYSIIKLYGNGYTQAFHKIESELETSEKSRLKLTTSSGPSADDDALGDLEDRSFVIDLTANIPPFISSISATPTSISPGGTSTIDVQAYDPEGDELTYTYDTTGGTISGSGPIVTYQAPEETGRYTISVIVNDGEDDSSEESVDVIVTHTPPPPINNPPTLKEVVTSSTSIGTGEVVEITVTATDPDDDGLSYHYEASDGTISGTGEQVEWEAPHYTGEFTIEVWVSDGELTSSKEDITISVFEKSDEKKDSSGGLPGFDIIVLLISVLIIICSFKLRKKIELQKQ